MRSLSPIFKREGDEVKVRSYAVSFSSLEFLCLGQFFIHNLVGNWGHHLETLDPKNALFRELYTLESFALYFLLQLT